MNNKLETLIIATITPIEDIIILLDLAIRTNNINRINSASLLIAFKNIISDEEISQFLLYDEILPSLFEKIKILFNIDLSLDMSVKLLLNPVLKFKN